MENKKPPLRAGMIQIISALALVCASSGAPPRPAFMAAHAHHLVLRTAGARPPRGVIICPGLARRTAVRCVAASARRGVWRGAIPLHESTHSVASSCRSAEGTAFKEILLS